MRRTTRSRYRGHLVHPQYWPADLDVAGKKVVVIGSGATAMSLVPALADQAAHVTMLQRSPSFVLSIPAQDTFVRGLSAIFSAKLTYRLARTRSAVFYALSFGFIRKYPELARKWLQKGVERRLGSTALREHFTPTYDPWDQRISLLPDGDLFDAISDGRASVVTDCINQFTRDGILLASGKQLDADIVVTATGLKLNFFGDAALCVDGQPVSAGTLVSYKGVMYAGLPNLAVTFGYTNSSWTLKADVVSDYVARLMNILERRGAQEVVPILDDPDMPTKSYFQLDSGYVHRAARDLPRQGEQAPWTVNQNYYKDLFQISWSRIEDSALRFR